ncbi:hypothetical protein BLNAU_15708 [Blattamonas nauphoetae]|uniref:HAT C-terminal dimerisation domain-containing protein n=1 Tax=Blattamonas nauphoetae TaxID=2049346 RepID=A0ABQ9X9V9_9EUKA|nr:hypothetical protein BLNAU_15708 [Blattamonas nauphoetae]
MERLGSKRRTLTKPVNTRWITKLSAIRETLTFLEVILRINQPDTDPTTAQLCSFFSDTQNVVRLALLEYLLSQANEISLLLQTDTLSMPQTRFIVNRFRNEITSQNPDEFEEFLSIKLSEHTQLNFEPYIESSHQECRQLAQALFNSITIRFLIPDQTEDLEYFSHSTLLLPDSEREDSKMLSLAQLFQNIIPPLQRKNILTHWRHLKSVYKAHFSLVPLTKTQLLDLILSNHLFHSLESILPIIIALKTIASTSVPTEREFSVLHYTQRKERSQLRIPHLCTLTRILHNSPKMLSFDMYPSIQATWTELHSPRGTKRSFSGEPRIVVVHDDFDDELSEGWDEL